MHTIKQTLGINAHKSLDNLPQGWSYKNYHHPMEWMNNVRWFFSMEDIYTRDGNDRKTPRTFRPALTCESNQTCPTQPCDPALGWNGLENAKVRYFCDDSKYPSHFNTELFALARIEDTLGNVRNFIHKHWDVDEWSSCIKGGIVTQNCLDEIRHYGKEMAQILNHHFSSRVTHVHLNEFWDPARKPEYHAFQAGLKEDALHFSVISNSMQASDRTIGGLTYDNYMDDYFVLTDDAICIHPYSFTSGQQGGDAGNKLNGKPEEMYWGAAPRKHTEIKDLVDWRDNNHPNKPIWITEIGWNSGDPNMDQQIQSDYTVRALLLAMAHNIEKVFFYWLRDTPDSFFGTTGWLDQAYNPKQIYLDMENIMHRYKDHSFDSWISGPGNNYVALKLKGLNNEEAIVEWNVDNSVTQVDGRRVSGKPTFTPIGIGNNNPVRVNLGQFLPNLPANGKWKYGTADNRAHLPIGFNLDETTGVLQVANDAINGTHPFTFVNDYGDQGKSVVACITINVKI